jgi:hypothetical protein
MENPEIPENFKSKNLLIEIFREIKILYETFFMANSDYYASNGAYKNPLILMKNI